MQGAINDVQKEAFRELIYQRIPELIRGASCELNGYTLLFEPLNASNYLAVEEEGTVFYSIKAACVLRDNLTGETVRFNVELLRIPVLQELGFKIKGNYKQQLDVYERAVGWNFFVNKKQEDIATLMAENSRSIHFNLTNAGPLVKFMLNGENKKSKIGISTFFRAISGCSNETLISMFGYSNPYVMQAFGRYADERPITMCIRDVAEAVRNNSSAMNSTVLVLKRDIETNLFSQRYFPLGSNAVRLNYFQSYSYRCCAIIKL